VDHGRVVGWNIAATTEEDAEAPEILWAEMANESTRLDTKCTEGKED